MILKTRVYKKKKKKKKEKENIVSRNINRDGEKNTLQVLGVAHIQLPTAFSIYRDRSMKTFCRLRTPSNLSLATFFRRLHGSFSSRIVNCNLQGEREKERDVSRVLSELLDNISQWGGAEMEIRKEPVSRQSNLLCTSIESKLPTSTRPATENDIRLTWPSLPLRSDRLLFLLPCCC